MAEFMLHHTHRPEDCGSIFPALQNVDSSLKGKSFFCTCPSGEHGGIFQVVADSAEEARNLLPVEMRATTIVLSGAHMPIP